MTEKNGDFVSLFKEKNLLEGLNRLNFHHVNCCCENPSDCWSTELIEIIHAYIYKDEI